MIVIVPKHKGNKNAKPPKQNYGERVFSDKSMKHVTTIGTNWGLVIRHANKEYKTKVPLQFVFFTLTLASDQIHPDQKINRECLQPFLKEIRKACQCDYNYLWRAETQKNGRIHYHILVDRFLEKDWLTNMWNRCQNRLGYVDRCDFTNPPSTEIEKVRDADQITYYIGKYMSKRDIIKKGEPERRLVAGKLWGCSMELKKLDCRLDLDIHNDDIEEFAEHLIKQGAKRNVINEFVQTFVFKSKQLELMIGTIFFNQFWERVENNYNVIGSVVENYRFINFNFC